MIMHTDRVHTLRALGPVCTPGSIYIHTSGQSSLVSQTNTDHTSNTKRMSNHAIGLDRNIVELFTPGTELPDEYVSSLDEFKNNLATRYGLTAEVCAKLPWRPDGEGKTDRAQLILAGGAPLNCLFKNKTPTDDSGIDLFTIRSMKEREVKPMPPPGVYPLGHVALRKNLYTDISIKELANGDGENVYILTQSWDTLDVYVKGMRKIQFIVQMTDTYGGRLQTFDHNVCAVAFDGERVYCLRSTIASLHTKISLLKAERSVSIAGYDSMETRMRKIEALGFTIKWNPPEYNNVAYYTVRKVWHPDFSKSAVWNYEDCIKRIRILTFEHPNSGGSFVGPRLGRHLSPQERWWFASVLQRLWRRRKWVRLAKASKKESFIQWFYHPDGIGGRMARKELESFVHGLSKRQPPKGENGEEEEKGDKKVRLI